MRKRKRTISRVWVVLAALLMRGGLLAAQPAARTLKLTLDKAVEIALADNPTIRVAEQDIELKKVSRKEAWQSLLPTVDLNAGMTYTIKAATMNLGGQKFKMGKDGTSTWNGALAVNLPVYAPAVYRTMKMTKTDIELAVEKSRGSRIDLINQVTKAYYQLMLAQDSYDVLKRSYEHSEKNFNVVNAKFQQGSVSEYDKISAEVQMRNLKPGVVSAENAVSLAKVQLKVLLGISDKELLVEVDDSLANYETMVQEYRPQTVSLDNNTQLKQIDLNGRLLEHSLKIQRTNFIPTISFNYAYQYQSLYNNNFELWHYDWFPSSTFGLTLSVPLYRASNFTKVKSTRIQMRQLAENRVHTERQLDMQVKAYQDNMMASNVQLSSNRESVAQAEKGLLIAEKRYEVGKGTVLEMNSSEVALTQARLAFNQSIYDYLVAKSDLEYVTGNRE